MHSSCRIFLTCHISETARDRHILTWNKKTGNCVFYPVAPFLITLDDPHTNIPYFLSRDAMLARYILGDGPVLVRPSVRLGAEGPRDAKSWRGTRVATSYMRLIATAAQQWRGRCIHAACCYRCAAVSRSVHPHGLLLLGLWSNNRAALPCFSSLLHVYCCKYNYWHG